MSLKAVSRGPATGFESPPNWSMPSAAIISGPNVMIVICKDLFALQDDRLTLKILMAMQVKLTKEDQTRWNDEFLKGSKDSIII